MHKTIKISGATAGLGIISLVLMGASSCDTSGGNAAGSNNNNNSVKTVAQGQPMVDSGKSVTVTTVQHNFTTGNEFEKAGAGKECLKVTVALANTSGSEWLLPLSDLSVVDGSGQKYQNSFTCGSGGTDIQSLVAGGHATGAAIFEVPLNSPLNFTFSNILGSTIQSLIH